ncbi:MAG: hypothetical protein PHR68_03925 [Candidatus Gracilibacteria bacterium]|nr:hypothetical protein [Candidatus Gracilibacteria bacterium]
MENFGKFSMNFVYRTSLFLIIFSIILGGFAFYQNKINPAMMPVYHITNGNKKIVFHAMSHIASPGFYNDVKDDISSLKNDNFVLFYEGVKPGKEESYDKFDKALGVKFDADLYVNMSKLYGLIKQDNSMFLGLLKNKDKNVDLSMDEIVKLYEKDKTLSGEKDDLKMPVDANVLITELLSKLDDKQLSILRFINQSIMNTIIKNQNIQDSMASAIGNKTIMDTILGKRNTYLIKAIKEEKNKNIVITYGLLHFKGVFEELQKQDKNWKLEKTDYLQVIR